MFLPDTHSLKANFVGLFVFEPFPHPDPKNHHDDNALAGVQSESEASANLCAINQFNEAPKPWRSDL